ncbi:26.2 kDa heat shock protein mitochondrial [Phtheirospermum japonicum]|uniref:26.2 kDa heat shock protein mitochondrial n=1 Tax=Phtheirospermum japonicum TaxID=374723 RepID=A0A830DCE0_9LAMI|nr:26.2 kDa heat shock protein mitochondrial [Phtheirospermum japonicum]
MSGVAKEDVEVYVDDGKMIAEGLKDFEDDEHDVVKRFRTHLPLDRVQADAIMSEMNNGVVKVRIPFQLF